ncbi:MAG: hypothetical protein ACOX0E_05710 [Syntrophomonadaceae bacterium]|jgi:hypothetical protein
MNSIEDKLDIINFHTSQFPELLDNIISDTFVLLESITDLRMAYKTNNSLPLPHNKSDFENLMKLVAIIEQEVLKFSSPARINKSLESYTSEEIQEIKQDEKRLKDSGLHEWIEEELID